MRTILALAALALVGCASVEQKPNAMYDSFERYSQAVAAGDVVAKRQEFFTPSALSQIDVNSENDLFDLRIGHYVLNEASHFGKVHGDRGCLTINGYENDASNPATLFLEYRNNGNTWLIDRSYVYVQQKEIFSGFVEHALCPDEAEQEIMSQVAKRTANRSN